MPTLFVTGAAGFIGSALCRHLRGQNCARVIGIDKMTYAASRASLAPLENDKNFELIEADIADAVRMAALFEAYKPDGVFHLAAETHVDRSIDHPADFMQSNIMGTYILLDTVRHYLEKASTETKRDFRFLHVSTDEVYGSLGTQGHFSETSPYAPNSPYAASKAAADHLVRAWHQTYGVPVLISNCSNNYGPYQFPEKLIPLCILKGLKGERLPIYGKGLNVRDWLYVEDHAEALYCIFRKGRPGQKYHVGSASEARNIDLIEKICELLDELRPTNKPHKKLITFVADRPGHDQRYAMNFSKLKSELGWTPHTALKDGLRRTVEWYLAHDAWCDEISARSYAGERLGLSHAPESFPRMTEKRIMLLGAQGQIGRALSVETPDDWELGAYARNDLDITDHGAVQGALRNFRPDFIINAAALTGVDQAEKNLALATAVNFEAVANLAAQASAMDIPILQLSTDYVFDGCDGNIPYKPDDKMNPLSVYAHSKLMGEEALRHGHPFHIILRVSSVFSEFGTNLLIKTLQMIDERDELKIVDDQRSCPTYAPDLAGAIVTVASSILKGKYDGFGTFHYCGEPDVTRFELVQEIVDAYAPYSGRRPTMTPIKSADLPGFARRPTYSVLDCSKIHDIYGIRQRPWREGLKNALKVLMQERGKTV